eukprot:9660650-Karenia_brevis.AAC.1
MENEMQSFHDEHANCNDPQIVSDVWKGAFDRASQVLQTNIVLTKNRPWISDRTLQHIVERNAARKEGREDDEVKANRLIKNSVKEDRRQWFQDMLESGDWSA